MRQIVIAFIVLALSACGIRMSHTDLVDEWGNTYHLSGKEAFQEKEIYSNNTTDVWGLEKTACKDFSRIDSMAYSGKSCLRLEWNKSGNCPWIGMGIGWNGYAAKDLSEQMATGTLSFYLRAEKGEQFIPTLILLLEDYSGLQSAAVLKAKHLSKYPIDTQWQKVSIPLSLFLQSPAPLCDFSNIKSLNLEVQGAGCLLLDQFEIDGSPLAQTNGNKYGQTLSRNFPFTIFHDQLKDAWGDGKYEGRVLLVDTLMAFDGKASLHLSWNLNEAKKANNQFGFSWEHWQATGFADSLYKYAIRFKVYEDIPQSINKLQLGFESYNGKVVRTALLDSNLNDVVQKQGWHTLTVPFTQFDFSREKFDINRFKQLLFFFEQSGELHLDEIELIKLPAYE